MCDTPLYIVEDHSDILDHILKSIGSKKLSFQNNLLIHFDAHPDLLINTDLKSSEIYEKDVLLEKVSIETWILPLAFAGHVTSIVWIKPEWARQIDDGSYTFVIGQDSNFNIKVSLPNLYFISALNYAPERELTERRSISLNVITLENSDQSCKKCLSELKRLIRECENNHYILDIDLDFFATCNPFLNLFAECNVYNILRTIYKFNESELISPELAVARRSKQLENMETIFRGLNTCQVDDAKNLIDHIDNNILPSSFENLGAHEMFCDMCKNIVKSKKPIDWLLIHDAGTTIDDKRRELPDHNNPIDTAAYLDHFRYIIADLDRPKLISIARSSLDDYCPPEHVDAIQMTVISALKLKYSPKIYENYLDIEPL